MMKGGGFYRIRFTGKALSVPTKMNVHGKYISLDFDTALDPVSASDLSNFEVHTWQLLRSKKYGSDRLNQKTLKITKVQVEGKKLILHIENLEPVDVITIDYKVRNTKGETLNGSLQGTIHKLR